MKQQEQYSWEGINVTVNRKRMRNLIIRIRKPGAEVVVSAPAGISASTIQKFIISKKKWIGKHRERILNSVPVAEKEYSTGEIHLLFGKAHRLRVIAKTGSQHLPEVLEDEIVLPVLPDATREIRMATLYSFYAGQLASELPSVIARWEIVMGTKVIKTGLRKMKTRWGSCNRQAARIWINTELARCPLYLTEYIVVHEMVHLFEGGHNSRFYSLMDNYLPEWRNFREELKKYSL